jgi:hypothetical protein
VRGLDQPAELLRPYEVDTLSIIPRLDEERANIARSECSGKVLRIGAKARRVNVDPGPKTSVRGDIARGRKPAGWA